MAKEFDIFLKRQVSECDIIVYSLPFHDGLSVVDRLILESCVESYLLQKFIAVQTGSELVAHIDEMIKTCYERLNAGTVIDASADFKVSYAVPHISNRIIIGADDVELLANSFADAQNAIILTAGPLLASVSYPFGEFRTRFALDTDLSEVKQSLIRAVSGVTFGASDIETSKTSILTIDAPIAPQAELADLCYQIYGTAETALCLAQYVFGTELHYSLGFGSDVVAFGSQVSGTSAQKFETVEDAIEIIATVAEKAIKFISLDDNAIAFDSAAAAIVKRHRLLSEMDNYTHADFDDMTLEELDYVIL